MVWSLNEEEVGEVTCDRSARDGAVLGLAGHLLQKGKSGGAGSPYSCIWQLKQTP